MATTTPNFGWDVPQSTDLVKDGATAIAALGNDIDTSLVDLKGGTTGQVLSKNSNTDMDFTWVAQDDSNAIQNSIVNAKGDLISASANDTPAILSVGTNGKYLIADSTTATGLKWGDVSAGAYTSLATGTLSSTTTTISSISGSYRDLVLVINDPYVNSATPLALRLNSITTATYLKTSATFDTAAWNATGSNQTKIEISGQNLPTTASQNNMAVITIKEYASTHYKVVEGNYSSSNNGDKCFGISKNTGAITALNITTTNGTSTFSGGTYTLYGVK